MSTPHLILPTLLCCASPLLARQQGGAQPQAQEPAADTASVQDERTRDLNRVLYLASGGSVRGRSRWVDDHWEYRREGEWSVLPAGAVVREVGERELLAQAKELERRVGRDETAPRVALADWMWRAGLLEECFAQLDRVLNADPDQRDALALLAAPPSPIAVPGEHDAPAEAVRKCAMVPPALAELAIARFAEREDEGALLGELRQALTSHSPRLRLFAARALRRLQPGESVREMLGRAVLDGAQSVRREAALALRDVGDEAVLLPVLRAMGSSTAAVRYNAADALGEMGYPAAVMPLMARLEALSAPQGGSGFTAPRNHIFVGKQVAYVQDFDVEVAQFASVADPQINTLIEGSVLDVRVIGAYETSTSIESRHVRSSLGELTGASPGNSNRAWLEWWAQHRSRYETPAKPSGPATRTSN